ncbi:hypothetical protein DWX89_09075 [Coprobacillus sp. AF21-8LB]|jgi:hypothetical protein|nr:hypothetical protein DWX89_09075 [Coprobacillus sp. AF21-8LB]DAZ62262.1 MAG TPA: Proteasome-associated ATPase, Prokaryotic ubiquitin-like protein coil alpha helix, ATP-binding.8A [Caudoviricetes sp.]
MLYAVNKNKEVAIEEKDEQSYLSNGYDIYETDEDGKIKLKTASPSKKVSYEKYQTLADEKEKVVKENEKLAEELKKAKEEIKKLKEK